MRTCMRSLVRALSWARVPAWACCLGGREAGRAWRQGACFWEWQLWEGWVFFGSCGNSLLLAENYNRTTTNNTTEAQSAQRLNGGGRNSLRLDDPCELWASLARLPIDRASFSLRSHPHFGIIHLFNAYNIFYEDVGRAIIIFIHLLKSN